MGVPKLFQDVAPYAETAILGELPEHVTAIEVKQLHIDGPSMVYHVYNLVARAQNMEADAVYSSPIYHHINNCCKQFLDDLEASGATILNIVFDGALPIRKRPTRQDRLEKTRQQLDNFRRAYPRWPPFNLSQPTTRQASSAPIRSENFRKILWEYSVAVGSKYQPSLPPPFMVASVIESLRRSKWSDVTSIVPGEADEYCAAEAIRSGGAILSNDSDLLLYELGSGSVVVMLNSLQLMDIDKRFTFCQLKAQCYRPAEVARRLGVPSMLSFGFQRLRDIGPRTAVIAQRAREDRPEEDNATWLDFRDEYRGLTTVFVQRSPKLLQTLDPRIAEIICSSLKNETLHLYFPMMLEDPTRDTVWSYGLPIRQLAYTVLLRHLNRKYRDHHYSQVTEHSRRGARIGDNEVSPLSEEFFQQGLLTFSALAGICCPQMYWAVSSGARDAANSQNQSNDSPSKSDTALNLYLLAACIVVNQRPQKSDLHKASCLRLFARTSLGATPCVRRHKLTWEDLHFFAALQCTLYSLRLFKQVSDYVEACGDTQLRHDTSGANLVSLVDNMPEVADIFIEATSLQNVQLCCSKEHIEALFEIVGKYHNESRHPSEGPLANPTTNISSYAHESKQTSHAWKLDTYREQSDVSKRPRPGKVTTVDRKTRKS